MTSHKKNVLLIRKTAEKDLSPIGSAYPEKSRVKGQWSHSFCEMSFPSLVKEQLWLQMW